MSISRRIPIFIFHIPSSHFLELHYRSVDRHFLEHKNDYVIITHQNFKIDKFGNFSSDIDYNSRTDIFRDASSLVINQCDPRRPKGASGGHKVSASRAAQASKARLLLMTLQVS